MKIGTVLKVTRRHVDVCDASLEVISGKIGSRDLDVMIGDTVNYSVEHGEGVIESVLPRKNCIMRSYDQKRKRLASNVDLMLIVTAVPPLFNTHSIDRMLVVASEQRIPASLVINKIDLAAERENISPSIDYYKKIGIEIIETSAKRGDNLELVRSKLAPNDLSIALLGGVSGVGKSSLLNALIPGSDARTKETSRKTGQGRQVTSGSVAYIYPRSSRPAFLIDLPGLQHYGVSHLSEDDVRRGFPEIWEVGQACEFSNCSHIKEESCAVLEAVDQYQIAPFRYLSYLSMIEEIRASKPY